MTELSVHTSSFPQTARDDRTGMTAEQELRFAELTVHAFLDPAVGERAAEVGPGIFREDFTDLGPAGACLLTMCWEARYEDTVAGAAAYGA